MSHADIPLQGIQYIRCKDFIDQSHSFVDFCRPLGAFRIADGNAAAFLSPMLQCKQSIVYGAGYIIPIQVVHSEHATFFMQAVISVILLLSVNFIHMNPPCRGNQYIIYKPKRLKTSLYASSTFPKSLLNLSLSSFSWVLTSHNLHVSGEISSARIISP